MKWMRARVRPRLRVCLRSWSTARDELAEGDDLKSYCRCRADAQVWKPSRTPHEHAEHRARQRLVPRQQIAKTIRKSQRPLAHGTRGSTSSTRRAAEPFPEREDAERALQLSGISSSTSE